MGTRGSGGLRGVARAVPRRDRSGADPAREEARRHPQGPRAQEEATGAAAPGRLHCRSREPPAQGGDKASAPRRRHGKQKGASKSAAPAGPAAPSFSRAVHPLFVTTCKPCHAPGAPGGVSRLLLSGDAAADHKVIARFVNARNPEASVLLGKVSGATMHAGGAPWPTAGAQYSGCWRGFGAGRGSMRARRQSPRRRRPRPRRASRAPRRGAHRPRPAAPGHRQRRPCRSHRSPGRPRRRRHPPLWSRTLTPTLSRKREREKRIGQGRARQALRRACIPC